jgi:hypothetical protein
LQFPLYSLEIEDIISVVESSCTAYIRLKSFFQLAGTLENIESHIAESSQSVTQEKKESGLRRCY